MNKKEKKPVLSVSKIKERGWTDAMIRNLLGDPDETKLNPFYRGAAPMKLYYEERVIAVEQTQEFDSAKDKQAVRKASACKAVQTKKDKAIAYANSIEVTIPVMPWKKVLKCAINSYNDFHFEMQIYRGHEFTPASIDSDPEFLARICTNFLRHECTDYEYQVHQMFGKVGVQQVHDIIQKKINDKILETYPQIKEMSN